VARLDDAEQRARIKEGLIHTIKTDRGGGDPSRIQVAYFKPDLSLNGKTFREILVERGLEPNLDNTAELAIEVQRAGGGQAIYHAIHEDDVKRIMQHPQVSIATDTGALTYGRGNPHPRGYGTFPRVLGKYVREDGVITLEQAIHKMTGMPAARLGITDRGLIREGYAADLVVFDPDSIADQATFTDPHRYARGIQQVIVNGQQAFTERGITGVRAGVGLRRPGM